MTCTQDELDHEKEGVIKYQLQFREQALSERFLCQNSSSFNTLTEVLFELNSSRSLLKVKGLIGQDPTRYNGDGFGNLSVRTTSLAFVISGSQTGHIDTLSAADVAEVEHFNVQQNHLTAHGQTKPSSESMTHGVCFQTFDDIGAVVHVHSPDIWHAIDELDLPFTAHSIPYGTPQMAQAVSTLLQAHYQHGQTTIFAMKGHEDGIVAVGKNLISCTSSLLDCLNQSILLKRTSR